MKQIKASEVKPGMTVKFDMDGWHVEGTVSRVEPVTFGLEFYSTQGVEMTLGVLTLVTVLAEPQPEEPTTFGARVVAGGRKFVRGQNDAWPWVESLDGEIYNWGDVCNEGQVTVIDAEPSWTAPEQTHDTPEVPERIEEWPEDGDEHLRAYKWVDSDECEWRHVGNGEWRFVTRSGDLSYPHPRPWDGPWTRVTDA